jgi:hypothetical protein
MAAANNTAPALDIETVMAPLINMASERGFERVPLKMVSTLWQEAKCVAYASLTCKAKDELRASLTRQRDRLLKQIVQVCHCTSARGACRKCEKANALVTASINALMSKYPSMDLESNREPAGPHGNIHCHSLVPRPLFCTLQQFYAWAEEEYGSSSEVSDEGTETEEERGTAGDGDESPASSCEPQASPFGTGDTPPAVSSWYEARSVYPGEDELFGNEQDVGGSAGGDDGGSDAGRGSPATPSAFKVVSPKAAKWRPDSGVPGPAESSPEVPLLPGSRKAKAAAARAAGMVPAVSSSLQRQSLIQEWLKPSADVAYSPAATDHDAGACDEPTGASEYDVSVLMEGQAAPPNGVGTSDSGSSVMRLSAEALFPPDERTERNPRFVHIAPTSTYSGSEVLGWSSAALQVLEDSAQRADVRVQEASRLADFAIEASVRAQRELNELRNSIALMRGHGFLLERRLD